MADEGKAAGPGKPRRPAAAKKEPEPEAPAPTPESIGIEGTIRVGGHVIGEGGWEPEPEPEPETPADKED